MPIKDITMTLQSRDAEKAPVPRLMILGIIVIAFGLAMSATVAISHAIARKLAKSKGKRR